MSEDTKVDIYWYSKYLINRAYEIMQTGDFSKAYRECLCEYNHGHSGFTDGEYQIFTRPKDKEEQELSKIYLDIHKKVAHGLTQSLLGDIDKMDDFSISMGIESVMICLKRLFGNITQEEIASFMNICRIIEDKKIHPNIWLNVQAFLALLQADDYRGICNLHEKFFYNNPRSMISRVMIMNTHFFSNNIEKGNYYIKNEIIDSIRTTVTTPIFLLVDLYRESKNAHQNKLPTVFEGLQVCFVYRDQQKMYELTKNF